MLLYPLHNRPQSSYCHMSRDCSVAPIITAFLMVSVVIMFILNIDADEPQVMRRRKRISIL